MSAKKEKNNISTKLIKINNKTIPLTYSKDAWYYPITYILRNFGFSESYVSKIETRFIEFDFSFLGTPNNINKSKAFTYDEFRIWLNKTKIRKHLWINNNKIELYNQLLSYFNLKEKCIYINKLYNKYEQFLIDNSNSSSKEICCRCHTEYPFTSVFFEYGSNKSLKRICRYCNSRYSDKEIYWFLKTLNSHDKHNLAQLNEKYIKLYMYDRYKFYVNYYNDTILKNINHLNFKELPPILNNQDSKIIILKFLYANNYINKQNLTKKTLNKYLISDVDLKNAYTLLYPDYYYKPFLYKNSPISNYSNLEVIHIIKNFLNYKNIPHTLDELKELNFQNLIRECRLTKHNLAKDKLMFFYLFFNKTIPPYKFKITSINFYKNRETRIETLKYLIEKDLKIPIEKIPLYLTNTLLKKHAPSLYYVLKKGVYYKNLFEWVNDCYPNQFIEADFNINYTRDYFDSIEESIINDWIKSKSNNLIYNKHSGNTGFNIIGMMPDWVLLTNEKVYLIEYFGLYLPKQIKNTRVKKYIEKTNNKIQKYKELEKQGVYKLIDIYPNDLSDNFKGLNEKFKNILSL